MEKRPLTPGELNSGHHLCSNELVQAKQNSEDSNWRIRTLLSTCVTKFGRDRSILCV